MVNHLLKYLLCAFLMTLGGTLSAQKAAEQKKQSISKTPVSEQIISEEELSRAKTIRDLTPSFPESCKILNWELVCVTNSGIVKILKPQDGLDLQIFLRKHKWKSLYIDLNSTCKYDSLHSVKIIVGSGSKQ